MNAPPAPRRYRMRDLCALTGLSRQAIHFYVQEGLLPPGHKTGRNSAWYDDAHVERLLLVRRLQHERFLPLRTIRDLLDATDAEYTPPQRSVLREVRGLLGAGTAAADDVPLDALLDAGESTREDVDELAGLGRVTLRPSPGGTPMVSAGDAELLRLRGELRRAGLTRALGFAAEDLQIYEAAVMGLVKQEAALVARRLGHLPPAEAAEVIARVLPLIGALLARAHTTRATDYLSTF